jgi:hypothetical protein
MKVKAEIQSLSSFDFQCVGARQRRPRPARATAQPPPPRRPPFHARRYLTHTYLPEKLKAGDWI